MTRFVCAWRALPPVFRWLGNHRRLSKDDAGRTGASEAFVYVAMFHLTLRRFAQDNAL